MKQEEIKLTLRNTTCRLLILENSGKPQSSFMHIHPYFEIFYIRRGSLKIILNEQEHYVNEGQACIIAPANYHQTSHSPDIQKFNVYFSFMPASNSNHKDSIYQNFAEAFSDFSLKIIDATETIQSAFSAILDIYTKNYFCRTERFQAECTRLLFALYDYLTPQTYVLEEAQDGYDDNEKLKYEIDLLLAQNYSNNISLDFLAKSMYVSKKKIAEMIKTLYGKPFREVKVEMKINVAKQLLKESNLSVSEIAKKVGYESTRGFLSAFMDFTGNTPSQYRTEQKG